MTLVVTGTATVAAATVEPPPATGPAARELEAARASYHGMVHRYEDVVASDLYQRGRRGSVDTRLSCERVVKPSARLARDIRDHTWPAGVRERIAFVVTATTTVAATAAECAAAPPQADVTGILDRWRRESLHAIVLGDEILYASSSRWKELAPTTTTTPEQAAASRARSCSYVTRAEARRIMGGPVHQVASDRACIYRVRKVTLIVEASAPGGRGSAADARKIRTGEGYPAVPFMRVVRIGPVAGYWQTTDDGHGSLQAYRVGPTCGS